MTCKDLNGCENDEIKTRECETLNEIDKQISLLASTT